MEQISVGLMKSNVKIW